MSTQQVETAKFGERECLHRKQGAEGRFYTGELYIGSLLRLRATAASRVAKNIGPFFWADAPQMKVWLCQTCARSLALD